MTIRNYAPQALLDFAVKHNRKRHGFLGHFESFAEALSECMGYEDQEIVQMYLQQFEKTIKEVWDAGPIRFLSNREVRFLNALQFAVSNRAHANSKIKILDFGGASGGHYRFVKSIFDKNLGEYVICESPKVAEEFKAFGTSEKYWISNLDGIESKYFDAVLSSGTIQYLEKPFEVLARMAEVSDYIVLDRLPVVNESKSLVLKQNTVTSNGVRVSYPGWFFSEEELFKAFTEFGLKVTLEWAVPEDRPYVNGNRVPYRGYLLEKLSPNE